MSLWLLLTVMDWEEWTILLFQSFHWRSLKIIYRGPIEFWKMPHLFLLSKWPENGLGNQGFCITKQMQQTFVAKNDIYVVDFTGVKFTGLNGKSKSESTWKSNAFFQCRDQASRLDAHATDGDHCTIHRMMNIL